jgi:quercetin dioxygenase-like cupin family protein
MNHVTIAGGVALVCLATAAPHAQDARPTPTAAWAPKPASTPAYPPGHKPWTPLAEIKARHAAPNWRERIIDDGRLTGDYESAVPGTTVARRFHPDTREWFAVVEGQVRVDIEGQAPFTATRGSIVNIPRQTMYALETVGDAPSLRFIVNVARVKTLFPREGADAAPPSAPAPPGMSWLPVTVNRNPSPYDQFNQPHVNIHDAAAKNDKYTGGRFVRDDKSELLIIYGYEKNLPPFDPADKGHFHPESAEFWLVFAGQIRYALEGQQPFVAAEGDIVYVPPGTWHATRFAGEKAACRLSITEYVGNTLLLEPRGGRGR